ncbi:MULTISPECIES: queuosine precursor transporter [Dickeya]|uniref:Probable queuosine precursor transporter n=1 Tax=Dickeya oryzae TaxID=1240404 RepID=A0AB39IL55_9GAMM|nr:MULTISPECIES: queuosine precursor transporter [Dickeya]MBP2847830.1 queuosine precursor transporter [Dickeya oryzae]MCA6990862.1 queuosine precursor transporter [Dickeya oryzae]MCA6994610.1 queuosine precursor transporter [Dickeya oryzae]MCO7254140.1 queuosine precursor transporter [Dickeya oryzae]UPT57111.1 queuosine precursor transporter [Dickeya zeae]
MDANKKFKLLGFNHSGELSANIMVLSTGKMIHMDLKELVDSEISDDLSRHELNALYKKLYAGKDITTAYDLSDRNERSWYAYLLITVMLSVIYIFSNVAGSKPIFIPSLNMVVPTAIFIYPFTFILVDILNEFYGLRLARRTIYVAFFSNVFFVISLWCTTLIPSLPEWELGKTYNGITESIMSVLVASSLAYLISENINAWVLHKIKIMTKSRYLFIRVITSTVTASAVDSVIFCTIAFYNVLSFDVIRTMILSQFLVKVVYAVLGVGPIYGTRRLFRKYIHAVPARN